MPAVDIDRQAIERRDFPITRRGYEPAAVDAHLRALAGEIEQLQRELSAGGGQASLASTAGTQVQSILAAAEATAAELERDAQDSARTTREEAARDAASTREQAIAQARGQVTFVTQATAALLERVNSMDTEVGALVESVRAGADSLTADLSAVEANMGELYDAASGQRATHAVSGESEQPLVPAPAPAPAPAPQLDMQAPLPPSPPLPPPASGAAAGNVRPAQADPPPLSPSETAESGVHIDPESPEGGDLDGARLIALNMALNGETREDADRYLADNFQLADRGKLIAEVFAAVEG
jgi:HAMP domain-containing protein